MLHDDKNQLLHIEKRLLKAEEEVKHQKRLLTMGMCSVVRFHFQRLVDFGLCVLKTKKVLKQTRVLVVEQPRKTENYGIKSPPQ